MEPLLDEKVVYGTKTVSQSADCQDIRRILSVVLDLTTKPVDVDHDRIVINGNRIAPDMLIDHIPGENLFADSS